LTRVDSEPGQEVGTEYPGRARMLVPKPGPAVSLKVNKFCFSVIEFNYNITYYLQKRYFNFSL